VILLFVAKHEDNCLVSRKKNYKYEAEYDAEFVSQDGEPVF